LGRAGTPFAAVSVVYRVLVRVLRQLPDQIGREVYCQP